MGRYKGTLRTSWLKTSHSGLSFNWHRNISLPTTVLRPNNERSYSLPTGTLTASPSELKTVILALDDK